MRSINATQLQLTKEQEAFIRHHRIPIEILIDAKGGPMGYELKSLMDKEDKHIAFNTTGCTRNAKHNFKTKAGHCPECRPATLSFTKREYSIAFVYIAGSIKGRLIKVGLCDDIQERARTLNKIGSKYANWNDWEILSYIKVLKAGKIERLTQNLLLKYKDIVQYEKGGEIQIATETFRCSYEKAKQALLVVLIDQGIVQVPIERQVVPLSSYKFPSLPWTI